MIQEKPEGGSRKKYTEEFKRSVIDHWQSSGKTNAEIAQEFGVIVRGVSIPPSLREDDSLEEIAAYSEGGDCNPAHNAPPQKAS